MQHISDTHAITLWLLGFAPNWVTSTSQLYWYSALCSVNLLLFSLEQTACVHEPWMPPINTCANLDSGHPCLWVVLWVLNHTTGEHRLVEWFMLMDIMYQASHTCICCLLVTTLWWFVCYDRGMPSTELPLVCGCEVQNFFMTGFEVLIHVAWLEYYTLDCCQLPHGMVEALASCGLTSVSLMKLDMPIGIMQMLSLHDVFTTTKNANINICFPTRCTQSLINGRIGHRFIKLESGTRPIHGFSSLNLGMKTFQQIPVFQTEHCTPTVVTVL